MKRLVLFIALLAGNTFAYNLEHRPFTPNIAPARIPLVDFPKPTNQVDANKKSSQILFETTNTPHARFLITNDERLNYVDFTFDGRDFLTKAPFGTFAEFGGVLDIKTADLNLDNSPDYIISNWLGGCGLASGYQNLGFLLSSGDTYKLTTMIALWPDARDYILIDGKPCIINTSFHEVEECTDGKNHGFWVYNLLAIDNDQIKLANELHPDFPKTIWYSSAPRHDETNLLTDEQKGKLQSDSLKNIFWVPPHE